MIHIGEDWYIDGDPLNISLYQKKTIEDGKNKGGEYKSSGTHYGTLQGLLDGLLKKKVRISVAEAKTLEQINSNVMITHAMIANFCKQFEREIKNRLKDLQETVKVPVYQIISEDQNGTMCRMVGEKTIPSSWGVKQILLRQGESWDE